MTKVVKFCGIDISKDSFDVAVANNGDCRSKKFAYDRQGMASLLKWLPADTHCVMESTGTYHCRLAYFLYENGIALSVVNPLSVKKYSQALMLRAKTDKADSRLLVKYGENFNTAAWSPRRDCYIEVQQLLNMQEQLIKQAGVWKNQLESLSYSVVQSQMVKDNLTAELSRIKQKLQAIEAELERLTIAVDKESYEHVCGIPGIGKKTAIVLIAVTQGMRGFANARQVSSYFGLCPRVCCSGTSIRGKGHICKMGMSQVRKLLYMCALSAKRTNKACKDLYERLLQAGKSKKLALIAVANKLLKQVYAIIKNNVPYDNNFFEKKFAF